jgi:hypothetical protein
MDTGCSVEKREERIARRLHTCYVKVLILHLPRAGVHNLALYYKCY